MADKKKIDSAKGKAKGVAFAKWAKIDSAQRNMFLAVCGASIVLGATVVGVVYFSKTIAFNSKLIAEKEQVIKDYVSIQKSLESISSQINDLRNSESLEVVSRTRSADCMKFKDALSEEEGIEMELIRICTALRMIPDAIPSKANVEATLASLNQLLLWSDGAIKIEGITNTDAESAPLYNENGGVVETTLHPIGAGVAIDDTTERVHRALDTIENSIRNYDIASATISFSGDSTTSESIELNASFRAYYANPVSIEKQTKKVCASEESEKCSGRRKK